MKCYEERPLAVLWQGCGLWETGTAAWIEVLH